MFKNKSANTTNEEITYINRKYLAFCFAHSSGEVITRPTRVTDQTATLTDLILTSSPNKVSQSVVTDLSLSKENILPKSHKHCEKFFHSIKKSSMEKFLKIPREIVFQNYLTFTCVNDAYSDFSYRFAETITFIALAMAAIVGESGGHLRTLVWQANYISNAKTE